MNSKKKYPDWLFYIVLLIAIWSLIAVFMFILTCGFFPAVCHG